MTTGYKETLLHMGSQVKHVRKDYSKETKTRRRNAVIIKLIMSTNKHCQQHQRTHITAKHVVKSTRNVLFSDVKTEQKQQLRRF